MTRPLEGRTALIIGANGRIGGAIARSLGDAGAHLVLAARDAQRLADLKASLEAEDITCHPTAVDVTRDDEVLAVVRDATAAGMDIAVNNAGATHRPGPLGDLALEDIDRVLQTTLRGPLLAMRHELAMLPDGASIVNIASTAGLTGAPGMAAYVAAKHALVGLTRTAALDYASRGIRVNAVAPGSIDSGGITRQPEQVKHGIGSAAPLARLGAPVEVAAAVLWLASPAASYTTGAILTVDGGKGAQGA